MKRPTVAMKILDVWVTNRNEKGSHMNVVDIASVVYGPYLFSVKSKNTKAAQAGLIETIRNNIGHAINLAAEHNIDISIKRKPTKNDPKRKWQILGWRIFVAGEDESFLIDELNYKKENGESRIKSFVDLQSKVIEKELLAPKDVPQLEKHS